MVYGRLYGFGEAIMVKKGEFIEFAASLKEDILTKFPTETQIIIELSKKIIDLEERILKLEKQGVKE